MDAMTTDLLLTKKFHACVRPSFSRRTLVLDPGGFSEADAALGADAILVTHEHPDHFDEGRLRAALEANPAAEIWALRSVAGDAAGSRPFAVLGDYNVAPTDDDVHDVAAFEGLTHVTPAERAALASLRETGLSDVVPRPLKYDHPYTYWDYRQLAFPKNRGMRIDLTYGNKAFADAVTDSYVDREARKGKGTSDHAPVVVDLDL